jgi:hypothetical protein
MKAQEVIRRAYKLAGIIGRNDTLTSEEAQDGLMTLNEMLESWSTEITYVFSVQQSSFPLVYGQGAYTFGPGGDFPTRPSLIDSAFMRINNIDYPLIKIDVTDYASIAFKGNAAFPQYFYYNQSFPLSTLTLWGTPSTLPATLYVNEWTRLDQFANLVVDVEFPPGYQQAIIYNLAMLLAPNDGLEVLPTVARIATESLARIRALNLPDPVMKTEVGYISGVLGDRSYIGT